MTEKVYKNIEWLTTELGKGETCNPIVGCGGPGGVRCSFCYAERIANRFGDYLGYPKPDPFVPSYHPHRLEKIRKKRKPTIFFFGSMCDVCDGDVKSEWREECLQVMAENPRHTFILLTKQYKNVWKIAYDSPDGVIPWNVWVGITVNTRSQVWGIDMLRKVDCSVRFISFEPLLEDLANIVDLAGIEWIIIGAQSKQSAIKHLPAVPAFRPKKAWVQRLVHKAMVVQDTIPVSVPSTLVFLKPNLGDYIGDGWFDEKIEQMPDPRDHAPETFYMKTPRKEVSG